MKNIKFLIGFFLIVLIFMTGCKKDLLDQKPLDEITEAIFFNQTSDMELYMNSFYRYPILDYGRGYTGNDYSSLLFLYDMNSDNSIDEAFDPRLNGTIVIPASGGAWYYGDVRQINYFFDNYRKCKDPFDSYKHYVGEAHFFRAMIYFQLVRNFGDVLLYDKVLNTNSSELYAARTPRNVVVDHILADLDTAAMYMDVQSRDGGNRLDKWSALTLQSRVALYEGTWEKYHAGDPFGVANADPDKYLNKAAEAALGVISSGRFQIYNTGKPDQDYFDFFQLPDYAGNKEAILWKKFNPNLNLISYRFYLGTWPRGYGITKGLADSYLCTDGKPIGASPLFQGYGSLQEESQDRDPRFRQTIFTPDAPYADEGKTYANWGEGMYSKLYTKTDYSAPTGYVLRKGTTANQSQIHLSGGGEPIILFDYAEVLLNYAEAKAELGSITQADIDMSIEKLRDRVGMPNLVLSNITNDPNWDFPMLSPVINEIRRERRVELSLVGFRWHDIARWAAADELIAGRRPRGSKWGSDIPLNPFPDDTNGFMDPYQSAIPNGYGFKINRDYLLPLPMQELTLNDKLVQNPGW